MALKSTVVKVELQVSDLDRHYYAEHNLTLAQHPSETAERVMVRLLAFALHAHERLEFGRGLSDVEEPALWQRDYGGDIDLWIDVGQPDETRMRKACGRAAKVVVVNYGGRAADIWWDKLGGSLNRLRNLAVINLAEESVVALSELFERSMRLTAMIEDGELQLMGASGSATIRPLARKDFA